MTATVVVLAVPALVLLGVALHDAVRAPVLRRLAVRNIARRPVESTLVVVGALLGTAIIGASLVVGDSLDASIGDLARTQLGPIDEIVQLDGTDQRAELDQVVTQPPIAGVDGFLPMVTSGVSVAAGPPAAPGADRPVEPTAFAHEVDFDAARAFGGRPEDTGFATAGPTPAPGEAVVGEHLAATLEVAPGDTIEVFASGRSIELTVRSVLPQLGVAGFSPRPGAQSPVVFLAPGTLEQLAAGGAPGQPPQSLVLVSNDGGVFDSLAHEDDITFELEARTAAMERVQINEAKDRLLANARSTGRSFQALFGTVGGNAVAAGILLLVNIFVMLGEERRTELGVMRGVGVKRSAVARCFGLEGTLYSLVAAAAGTAAGVVVGWVLVQATGRIFEDGPFRLPVHLDVRGSSLLLAFLGGLLISMVTAWATSARIGRLNVIRAIRELPEPPRVPDRRRRLVAGLAGVVVGVLMTVAGVVGSAPALVLLGPVVVGCGAVPLLQRVLAARWAVTVPAAVVLLWSAGGLAVVPAVFEDVPIQVFLVQSLVSVAAAVVLAVTNDDALQRGADLLARRGRGVSLRLALANPRARKVRTGLLLGTYSIVVLVLVFLATFVGIIDAEVPRVAGEVRGGFDLVVDTNPASPPPLDALASQPGVAAVAPLQRARPQFATGYEPTPRSWPMSGFDDRLLAGGPPSLADRGASYPTDQAAWQAVRDDPGLAIVPDFFLQDGGGPLAGRLHPGDSFTVTDPTSGKLSSLRVAGVVSTDWTGNGVFVGAGAMPSLVEISTPARYYVAVDPGSDPAQVATALDRNLLTYGVDASTFESVVADGLSQTQGFLRLMQGYLVLGLVIGIAGLGVVMVRAVRERRHQIGMLRAMGFSRRVVRVAFLLEAVVVAAGGIVIGVGLGLVTAWSVLARSSAFGAQPLPFRVPWLALVLLPTVTLVASLAAVAVPAARASRISPAVALRATD